MYWVCVADGIPGIQSQCTHLISSAVDACIRRQAWSPVKSKLMFQAGLERQSKCGGSIRTTACHFGVWSEDRSVTLQRYLSNVTTQDTCLEGLVNLDPSLHECMHICWITLNIETFTEPIILDTDPCMNSKCMPTSLYFSFRVVIYYPSSVPPLQQVMNMQ